MAVPTIPILGILITMPRTATNTMVAYVVLPSSRFEPCQGTFGNASHVNDVVINHLGEGRLLRTDGIHLGRDAQVRGGTVGSGASRCKADLRYTMDHAGASLKVNGSILSLDGMHNDHHVEILHLAPETYSRLDWHSACRRRRARGHMSLF